MKYVVYEGRDEILVCTKKHERQLLSDWFGGDGGRDVDDYDRKVVKDEVVQVEGRVWLSVS